MDDISILAKLTPMLQTVFNDNSLTATLELTSGDVRDWDSLGQIRLFFEIEREFSVRFSPPEVTLAKSIGQIVDLIKLKAAGL